VVRGAFDGVHRGHLAVLARPRTTNGSVWSRPISVWMNPMLMAEVTRIPS
jgi:FAD synthase